MSKKKSAGLEALGALGDTLPAGKQAVESVTRQVSNKKTKVIAVRMTDVEDQQALDLALKLADHGVQVSKGNALRLALSLCKPTQKQIKQFVSDLNEMDGRKQK